MTSPAPLRVALLTGGSTLERNVALAGAARVAGALRNQGHAVNVADLCTGFIAEPDERRLFRAGLLEAPPSVEELAGLRAKEDWIAVVRHPLVQTADVIFPVVHGPGVEGGRFQALLEIAGVPFVGSDSRGSTLAMDKVVAKTLFAADGIPTAPWARWPLSSFDLARLRLPLVVKPNGGGSSIGLSVVHAWAELQAAVDLALSVDAEVIVEKFIAGRELSVGILGHGALGVGEIIPAHEIFDYECKYTPGLSEEIFPAALPSSLALKVEELALRAHRVLGLRHFSRVDFRLAPDGTPYCLEANSLPGLTESSLIPQAAFAAGIPFDEFCVRLCRMALGREHA